MTHCTTKTIKDAYRRFNDSATMYLYQCYDMPSMAKTNAFNYCMDLFNKYNGTKFRIIGYNTMQFSFGFIGSIGNDKAFFYITKDYDRYILLDEIDKF